MNQAQADREDAINQAARRLNEARSHLADLMRAACPGPHEFVQHRDKRPPWCPACRHTEDGLLVREG